MDASGYITEWNKAAEAMFGWSQEEALGRRVAATAKRLAA
jgi:PAS domain S-box-containing protein